MKTLPAAAFGIIVVFSCSTTPGAERAPRTEQDRTTSSRNDNRGRPSPNGSRAGRRSVNASAELRRTAVRELPELQSILTKTSDRFLVDLDVVRLGHPYMGRNSNRPHTGGHVYFKTPAKPDPRKPSTYPAIYAVADGFVSRIDYSFKLREMYEPALRKRVANYRYGVTLAIAQTEGAAVHFHYSIEPFIDPEDEQFYDRFLLVKPGQRVKKGDVIARMYIPPNERLAQKSHVHFNLMNTKTRRFMAPVIFSEKIVERFRVTWGRFGMDGKTTIPACMGYQLAADENPFGAGSNEAR